MGIISKAIETLSEKEMTSPSGKALGKALSHPPVRQDSSRVRTPSSADLVFDNVGNRRNRSRSIWRQAFDDREQQKPEHPLPPVPSWGRSVVSTDNATRRLLEALRSFAPGSWTDDRWEQSKHFLGITYVAVHRQNEILTQAEYKVYVKDEQHPDGKRPIRPDDPPMGNRMVRPWDLVQLLQNPNREDDFGDLISNWNLQMDLTGSALTWMVPNKLGTPYELYPIPTALAIPQPAVNPDYPDGYYRIQPVYPYGPFSSYPTPAAAVGAAIPAQWMMRFKYPHPLIRYEGYSPLTAMRSHIDQHESMDRARWYAMKRGVNPAAVLQFEDMEGAQPFPEEAIERIKADFENEHYGSENWSKLYVTAPGSKLEPFGNRPIDMDFQGGWEQVASFILGGGFGITKPAAGMSEASAYANLFASLKQLYWQTLDPKCSRIARKLTRFLGPYFGDDLIIEVHCKRIDDHEILFQKIDKAVSSKAVTKNGVLKLLDLPVTQEEWGDDIAGDPSPYEKEQQEKQMAPEGGGMPGMPGGMPGMDAGAAPAPGAPGMPGGPPEDEVPAALTPEQAPEAAGAATPTAPGEESDTPSITEILGLGVPETEGDQTSEEPNPESLDQQSLGHRKSLSPRDLQRELRKRQKAIARNYHRKSMYEQMMKVLESGPGEKHHTNGHTNGHTNEHLNGSTNGHAK